MQSRPKNTDAAPLYTCRYSLSVDGHVAAQMELQCHAAGIPMYDSRGVVKQQHGARSIGTLTRAWEVRFACHTLVATQSVGCPEIIDIGGADEKPERAKKERALRLGLGQERTGMLFMANAACPTRSQTGDWLASTTTRHQLRVSELGPHSPPNAHHAANASRLWGGSRSLTWTCRIVMQWPWRPVRHVARCCCCCCCCCCC